MLKTPVLLITFNRPEHTRKVLEEVKKQQPEKLFVFQDGAREGNKMDTEKCVAVRETINNLVDWNCELHTNFSEKNLGCGKGPARAITWFFEKEMKADLIFQFAFGASKDLLDFSKEIREIDEETAKNFYKKACKYINNFLFCLLKTSSIQKEQFFQLVRSKRNTIKLSLPYRNHLNKTLCRYPIMGYPISRLMTHFYPIKQQLKNKKRQAL